MRDGKVSSHSASRPLPASPDDTYIHPRHITDATLVIHAWYCVHFEILTAVIMPMPCLWPSTASASSFSAMMRWILELGFCESILVLLLHRTHRFILTVGTTRSAAALTSSQFALHDGVRLRTVMKQGTSASVPDSCQVPAM